LLETKKLVVVTEGLSAEKLADMEMERAASVDEAISRLATEYSQANVAVFPVGGATFPYLAKGHG
jgi:hypothetical protein